MLIGAALQGALPLVLMVMLFVYPPRSRLGYVMAVAGLVMLLLALALAGLRVVLPWWPPFAQMTLLSVLVVAHMRRLDLPSNRDRPFRIGLAVVSLSWFALFALASAVAILAFSDRSLPEVELVDMASPFDAGRFLIVNGGSNTLVNPHMKTLDQSAVVFLFAMTS